MFAVELYFPGQNWLEAMEGWFVLVVLIQTSIRRRIQMSRVKVTNELIEKVSKIFGASKTKAIFSSDIGLSRSELRVLVNAGILERLPTYGTRKWLDNPCQLVYAYRLVKSINTGKIK